MRIGVRIGKPLDFSRYEGMEDDRFVLRSITDELMYELMLLSRQEYVDMYATSMKDRLLAAAKAKAKDLQHEAADKIDKVDKNHNDKGLKGNKGLKGDEATLETDDSKRARGSATDKEGDLPSSQGGDDDDPPSAQGDERAAS
jgi:1-acyl-sn-glycerol-3-phosphate acyltransferase